MRQERLESTACNERLIVVGTSIPMEHEQMSDGRADSRSGPPAEPGYKRAMDFTLSVAGMALLLPLVSILCLLIRLTSRGPIFHLQERVGLGGRRFQIFKLRTMVDQAERATGPVWASVDDPRVTPLGRLLRKSHLDELPQLLNVMLGQMSLVGPRPERPAFVEKFERLIPDYGRRVRVRPGITGLAQVSQAYDASLDSVRKKLAYDLAYMETMGAMSDILIMIRTVKHLTGHEPHSTPALRVRSRLLYRRERSNVLNHNMIPTAPADLSHLHRSPLRRP
jgi:lipopolysaccharide/colanic/teichoic acid biosynthesis glycosyltransferase